MEMLDTISSYDWTSLPAVVGYITTALLSIFSVRERRLRLKSQKLDNIKMLESFLNEDIEQVHKVNDVLKFRLKLQQEEIEYYQQEIKKLKDERPIQTDA